MIHPAVRDDEPPAGAAQLSQPMIDRKAGDTCLISPIKD
jgi:hypothetical protein